jgi:hypothetical protein
MKCLRSVLVVFVVVVCFFLTGFKKPISNHKSSSKNQQSIGAKQQKPLDLTVPLSKVSFEDSPETLVMGQGTLTDALSVGNSGKPRGVELHGHLIMSQEPETGKMKSADGAGIGINLHH